MKTFSRFKVHLNNGTSQIHTIKKKQKAMTIREFLADSWPSAQHALIDPKGKVITPYHAVTRIEGLEEEK